MGPSARPPSGTRYRTRALALTSQGLGAVAGLGLGAVAGALAGQVAVAAGVALVCGMVGALGPMFTAGAVMAVIGTAFAQFSGVTMPWWEQSAWYLLATAIVSVPALLPWAVRRRSHERQAIAEVFRACADLLDAVGTGPAARLRVELAACSAGAHAAVLDHRLRAPRRHRDLLIALAAAQETAARAATYYVEGRASPELSSAARAAPPRCGPVGSPGSAVTTSSWRSRCDSARLPRRGPSAGDRWCSRACACPGAWPSRHCSPGWCTTEGTGTGSR
ncbi:FUSC family membrane protein [Amycolatopsis sp. DSM 110486]|uniref:FUSC family membrane protein n=1 Tax=Amycolatopsis sp. DSM 110486 TaxID=2865832 RepID=UPI001C6A82FE|nr:FUSC family membrane protein [Amycolatopsis sp. DSM 110486]QYN19878.1 hypothetical protein K1T34_46115 [Amycolatopsis sp. DSM 110486]